MDAIRDLARQAKLPLTSEDFSAWLDERDELREYRARFLIPKRATGTDDCALTTRDERKTTTTTTTTSYHHLCSLVLRLTLSGTHPILDNRTVDPDRTIYFCGNSLGCQPSAARAELEKDVAAWETLGVEGHFKGPLAWTQCEDQVSDMMASIVGALPPWTVAEECARFL